MADDLGKLRVPLDLRKVLDTPTKFDEFRAVLMMIDTISHSKKNILFLKELFKALK